MTIKDFTVGQTAYVHNDYDRRDNPVCGYRVVTVAKIGRSYVTLNDGWNSKYGVGFGGGNYLVEKVNVGSPRFLFRTKQDLDDFMEAKELRIKIRSAMDWQNIQKLSVAQLRAIRNIVEGEETNILREEPPKEET